MSDVSQYSTDRRKVGETFIISNQVIVTTRKSTSVKNYGDGS